MHQFHVQPAAPFAFAGTFGTGLASAVVRLKTLLAAMLGRGAKYDAASYYEGHAWTDSLESQINGDISTFRRARL